MMVKLLENKLTEACSHLKAAVMCQSLMYCLKRLIESQVILSIRLTKVAQIYVSIK